ncbi:hypothetical protein QTP88_025232 [Uroleucon formosanum]
MSYSPTSQPNVTKPDWLSRIENMKVNRKDMNKLIMNYLVSEGFKEAAEKFEQEAGISSPLKLNTLGNRIKVIESVQSGKMQEAITLINQLYPGLLDDDRDLYFHLQQLHLIELIKEGNIEEALVFAQAKLSEVGEGNPTILTELERTLALLAFEEPQKSPFADLLQTTHRQKVSSELNAAILRFHNQPTITPKLYNLMKLIMWAQDELDRKKVKFPHMTDFGSATLEPPK